MKINEVEALVGITKKNIRFYESEGLLSPPRNSLNGYRDYGAAEVEALRRIKLLRKLGVPLEEIRQMLSGGTPTVGGGMRRHLLTLERERRTLDAATALCAQLAACPLPLSQWDASEALARMEKMEQGGMTFMNRQKQDIQRRYVPPVLAAAAFTALMAAIIALILWDVHTDPGGAPPLPLLIVLLGIPCAAIGGVITALCQRLREIGRRDEDAVEKY